MASQKPTQAPAFDATTTWKVLDAELKKDDGSSYAVFQDQAFPRWKRWVESSGEFDGKGLRDVDNANALYLDAVKADLDDHRQADLARHQTINQRLAAVEAALTQPSPFPGVSS